MEQIVGDIAHDIWNKLGPGYSESVYHCAFEVGLRRLGIYYETERIIPVFYDGQNVGHVRADIIVNRTMVLELKSVGRLSEGYRIQTRNYLKLLDLEVGFLINFPDKTGKLEMERITQSVSPPTGVLDISSPISDLECTIFLSTSTEESMGDTDLPLAIHTSYTEHTSTKESSSVTEVCSSQKELG
jgi:hypothetical protein